MFACEGYEIVLKDHVAQNPHIMISGKSGTGKSVLLRQLAEDFAIRGEISVILDINGSFQGGHMKKMEKTLQLINEGLRLSFTKQEFESGQFAEILASAFRLKRREELGDFYDVAASVCKNWLKTAEQLNSLFWERREMSFSSIAGALENPTFEIREIAQKKLLRIGLPVSHLLTDYKMTTWRLDFSGLQAVQKTILAECVLQFIYSRAQSGMIGKKVHIFVDEFQQFQFPADSAFFRILTEGRKHHLGLCLATQFLKDAFSEKKIHQLEQAAMSFYFQPSNSEIQAVAKVLSKSGVEVPKCAHALANLHRGECIMIAPHSVGNSKVILECPRKVQVCTENI